MAERMSTATRMDRARANAKISRIENGMRKRKERANRDARMVALIKKGTFPYLPSIMSWASVKLGVPAHELSEEDVKKLAS
jgi:hypothetical protein